MTNSIHSAASRGTAIAGDSPASSGTAVVPHDARTTSVLTYTLSSTTTSMGHRSHTVVTRNHDFAQELFAHAHSVDIEPYLTRKRGQWSVEFVCNDGECALTIEAAKVTTAPKPTRAISSGFPGVCGGVLVALFVAESGGRA